MSTILITGATGALGSATIDHLLKLNTDHKIIGLARNEEKAASLKEKGVEVRIGNYDEPSTLEAAFSGVDTLFFISASEIGKRVEQHKNVVEAAKKADVKHIVYSSFFRKNETESSPIWMIAESHLLTEKLIKESEMTYTITLNNLYMDFVPMFLGEQVIDQGMIYLPAKDEKLAAVLRDDMAEAYAKILSGTGHENKLYNFSNSEAVSFKQIATYLSEISGKEIGYVSPDVEEYQKTLSEAGVPEEAIGITVGFSLAIAEKELNETSSDLENILGRKPVSLKDFLTKVYQ